MHIPFLPKKIKDGKSNGKLFKMLYVWELNVLLELDAGLGKQQNGEIKKTMN